MIHFMIYTCAFSTVKFHVFQDQAARTNQLWSKLSWLLSWLWIFMCFSCFSPCFLPLMFVCRASTSWKCLTAGWCWWHVLTTSHQDAWAVIPSTLLFPDLILALTMDWTLQMSLDLLFTSCKLSSVLWCVLYWNQVFEQLLSWRSWLSTLTLGLKASILPT